MTKILVTGGAGYIGSHTLVELSANNFEPIIVDNLCNTSTQNIQGAEKIIGKSIPFYNVDCTDENALNEVFEQEKNIEGAIHFAAFKSVEESVREPQKYHSNNIGSLQVLLNVMKTLFFLLPVRYMEVPIYCPLVKMRHSKRQNRHMVKPNNCAKNC